MNLEIIEKVIVDSALGEDCLGNRLYLNVNSEMVDWMLAEIKRLQIELQYADNAINMYRLRS